MPRMEGSSVVHRTASGWRRFRRRYQAFERYSKSRNGPLITYKIGDPHPLAHSPPTPTAPRPDATGSQAPT